MNIKKITAFLKKRKGLLIVVAIVGVGIVGYFTLFNKPVQHETQVISHGDFLQQVSVSGKVVPAEDVDLSFEQAGIVRGVYVKVGDKVSSGKLIATQDTAQLSTQLAQMKAGIDLQRAKLNQLLAGSSDEDIRVAQNTVDSANQDLADAYQNALITLNSANNSIYNVYVVATTMQNNYFFTGDQPSIQVKEARENINTVMQKTMAYLDSANSGSRKDIDAALSAMPIDLGKIYTNLQIIRTECDDGVYYSRVSSTDKASLDTQKTNITTSLTNTTSAKQTVDSDRIALLKAQNQLDAKKAAARPTDIAVFEAQIKQAEASEQDVITQIRKKQIYAPIAGIVTAANAKVGSIMGSGEVAISLISQGEFQIESYVPEIYISLIKIGNDADVTLDAYGTDKVFKAKVVTIDPAETIKDGVSTYRIKLELQDSADEVKTGMTANVIITTGKKQIKSKREKN
jgi:HlyD family secretion protein